MDNNMTALLNLYLSLGGNLTDTYDNIANGIPVSDYIIKPDIIDAIAERAKSAGIELPAVTSDDNSKLLTVVEGAWAKADPPKELPLVTDTDEGKFLRVNSSGQTEITIPEGVTSIGNGVFSGCTSLVEINLPSTLTSIGAGAFYNIDANAVINCAFSEGAVSGAPWGAADTVTINYDVTN